MMKNYAVSKGRTSRQLRLADRSATAEELVVARGAMLAEETDGAMRIYYISTTRSVTLVRRYKRKGVQITCETCPQYFSLTEDEILIQNALARVNPPLRTEADVEATIEGLKDSTINVIATDYTPHSVEERVRPLTDAPSGMVGLETAFIVTLTYLYHTGEMALSDIPRRITINPVCVLRLPTEGQLAIGSDGNVVILDSDKVWTVEPNRFTSRGRNIPFGGKILRGKVEYTIIGGEIVYREGE